jgi:hypothetical protein
MYVRMWWCGMRVSEPAWIRMTKKAAESDVGLAELEVEVQLLVVALLDGGRRGNL